MCDQRRSSDLELYTSEELIQELLSRTTFVGILIRSEKEAKGVSGHRSFRVDPSDNLNQEQMLTILDGLVGHLKEAAN
jgi:hypothetical protein